MARYWVYLNSQVMGPYELEQLIRLQGFSRQTMVSVDDYSGAVGKWISPAAIPELARIFQKADELHDSPAAPPPRIIPKPKPQMPVRLTPVPPPVEEKTSWTWLWVLLFAALAGGGFFRWNQVSQNQQRGEERQIAQTMIETVPLPSTSLYSTVRQYIQMKQIDTHWEFERQSSGLYNVGLSWAAQDSASSRLPVYAFEVNLQAQSVRGLNSSAIRLLSEGFPAPVAASKPAAAKPQRSPADTFPSALNDRRQAFEQGDFEGVWQTFSRRRKTEMEQGGISASGFVRMQKLTYRAGAGVEQTIVKIKPEPDGSQLVLMRQTQPKHPDIYIKQHWILEDNAWRLDEEEKKIAGSTAASDTVPTSTPSPAAEAEKPSPTPAPKTPPPASPPPSSSPSPRQTVPPNLPGFSDYMNPPNSN